MPLRHVMDSAKAQRDIASVSRPTLAVDAFHQQAYRDRWMSDGEESPHSVGRGGVQTPYRDDFSQLYSGAALRHPTATSKHVVYDDHHIGLRLLF